MIGLLKSANELPGVKQPTSGSDVLHAQETSKIEGKLDTRSVVSEACKQNCKQQQIALDYHENAESILGKKKFSKETCSSTPAKRFCDLTGAAPRKRQRIVSDTLCRHQFQPLFSKCDLVNEYRNRSPSSLYSKGSSRSEILQASLQRPIGTQTRHASKQHKDWSFDKAFYKAFYKCSHCSKENTVVVETRICPLKIQETPSASSESATFSQLLNDNGKQFDVKLQHTRPNVASMVCNTFDAVSNRDLYDKSNFSVKGEQIKVKEEKGCERHNGVYSDSENGLGNHSFRSRNSNHSHVNKSGPENLAILKAFTSNESKGQLNLTAKQLSKPSSEKPHCLKFIPRQYVDISSEDVPPDETKQSFSEVGGMENQAKAGDRSLSTKENFVKELNNIFSRLPLVKEERLKEEGVYKMILMAQAYCDKFESESRNENDRENSPQEDNWKSARLPNRASSAVDQKILDAVSNEYERNVTSFRCVDNSLSCKLAVEPAKTVCTNDILSVDRGKISVMSDKVIENRRKGIISSSVLVSQSNEKESRNVCTREESTTFVNNEAFRNNRIVDCSDITLSSNLKSCKKQRKLAGSSKKRRTVKKSCTHEACSTCMKCDDNATNTLGTVFSTSSGTSPADQTSVTEESAKKHSISVDKAFLAEGISNMKNGINTECYRFNGQSGEEKEHDKMQNCKFRTVHL